MLTIEKNQAKARNFAILFENELVEKNEYNEFKLHFLRSVMNDRYNEYSEGQIQAAFEYRVMVYLKNGDVFQAWNTGAIEDNGGCYHYWKCDGNHPKEAYDYDIEKMVDAEGNELSLEF